MKFWIATVSALAMAATPALAQGNGNGNGNGQGRGNGQQAQGNGGGGNGNAQRDNRGGGQEMRGNRGNGNGNGNRGGGGQDMRGNGNRGGGHDARGNGNGGGNGQAMRPQTRGNAGNGNGNGNADRAVRVETRGNDGYRVDTRDGRYADYGRDYRDWNRDRDGDFFDYVNTRNYAPLDGCPPGLARKNNGCNPPGQLRQSGDWDRYSDRYSRYSPDWWGLSRYDSGNYYYNDGYLMRYDGNRVGGYIPLFGGALSVGNPWPSNYGYNSMPRYYSDYYGFGNDYRYADNVVYRLDPQTSAIQSIAALLTGNDFVVGQPMPRGYDAYNVPYSYRDQYYDTPDSYYRYNNGYVYQVDPTTQLVQAAIELLL
ncbi:hypothetical protein [Aurantiacibacter luteus]|uniref:Uncharacterized protein n=1 Tax=Aurantiacibacter luteus TaxID=1581420 RepID=A0A0G9MSV0_9SPHN|nr:hypothetical protein [Aurantiacibacter luteus]KLE33801.1 hypothetical protein AAW00_12015 [Aurantiacibacter luteus]